MKNLLRILSVMVGIFLLMSGSQPVALSNGNVNGGPVTRGVNSRPISWDFICGGKEVIITGELTWEWVNYGDKFYMDRYKDCILQGSDGNEYEFSQSYTRKYTLDPTVWNETCTFILRLDGKLFILMHLTTHHTINANGEPIVDFDKLNWDCK